MGPVRMAGLAEDRACRDYDNRGLHDYVPLRNVGRPLIKEEHEIQKTHANGIYKSEYNAIGP